MIKIYSILILGSVLLNNIYAQGVDYYCKDIINRKEEKLDNKSFYFVPLCAVGIGIPFLIRFEQLSERYTQLGNTLANASMSQEEILESFENLIRDAYTPSDEESVLAALDVLNEKRARLGVGPMPLEEFEVFYHENYMFFIEERYKEDYYSPVARINRHKQRIKEGWPFVEATELFNKKAKTNFTPEQVKQFMLEQQNTDYFCPNGKALKMNKKSLRKIARDIKKSIN